MFPFHSSVRLFLRRALLLGALCVVVIIGGVAAVGTAARAQNAVPKEKVKAGAINLGQVNPLFTPNPNGLAIAPCPDPMPQRPLNQYVMNGGGGVFVIPCNVRYNGGDTGFYYRMVRGLDWTIQSTPSAMLPRVSNGGNTVGDNTSIFPQHTPPNNPQAVAGLAFSDVLPANSNNFGRNLVTHTLQGQTLATSPISLFYQASVYTHPVGDSKWCQDTAVGPGHSRPDYLIAGVSAVPNWFHYYSQVWTAPCKITFSPDSQLQPDPMTSYFEPNFPDHIHLNYNVSDSRTRAIFGYRPGSPFVREVGTQTRYGIDSFVTAVEHEYGHMRIFNAIQGGATDTDEDGLPDSMEKEVGLNPNKANSAKDLLGVNHYDDGEVYCKIMEQRTKGGPRESDWANNGLNWGRVPGSCDTLAIRRPIAYSWPQ